MPCAPLFAKQPIDVSLVPLFAVVESEASNLQSAALDVLVKVFSATANDPGSVSAAGAKALKSLSVWDQSELAANGRFKLDENMSTVAGLFPLHRALVALIVAAVARLADRPEAVTITTFAQNLTALDDELVAVTASPLLDISTIQRVIAWISEAIESSPEPVQDILQDTASSLQPIRRALALTSGEAMEAIWRSALPYKPTRASLAEAYRTLIQSVDAAAVPDPAVFDLALEVAVALGIPQNDVAGVRDQELMRVVQHLVARLAAAEPKAQETDDAVIAMARASNAVSYLTIDLAATAATSKTENMVRLYLPTCASELRHRALTRTATGIRAGRIARDRSQRTRNHAARDPAAAPTCCLASGRKTGSVRMIANEIGTVGLTGTVSCRHSRSSLRGLHGVGPAPCAGFERGEPRTFAPHFRPFFQR